MENNSNNNSLPGFSTTNPIYLVVVEDATLKDKKRAFITQYISNVNNLINFKGYEVSYNNRETIKSHQDALHSVINVNDVYDISYPIHKLISIRNVIYKSKK